MSDLSNFDILSSRDNIRLQIIELAKDYLELENFDFNKSSYLSYLVNVISVLDSNLMFYVSSVYREFFLTKCLTRDSVLAWADILGYSQTLATPATVSVLIEIPYSPSSSLEKVITFVGRHDDGNATGSVFKVYAGNIPFALQNTTTVTITNGVTVKQQVFLSETSNQLIGRKPIEHRIINNKIQFFLEFIQIEDHVEQFTIPQLLPNEFYSINYNFTNNGYISDIALFNIISNTSNVLEQWTRVNSIFGVGPDETVYSYRETNNGIIISFGNGVLGKQPKKGSEIIVSVGITLGYAGNVISGSITKCDSLIMTTTDSSNNSTTSNIQLSVVNKSPAINGTDSPSIDNIRTNAMKRVSTNSRLVSSYDFENAKLVIPSLPINNVYQVLKRSDLKRNEITLFTDLIYNNYIVPTKNLSLSINETETDISSNYIKIPEGCVIRDSEEIEYVTMFDTIIDKNKLECEYYYYLDSYDTVVSISKTGLINSENTTQIFPVYANFSTTRTNEGIVSSILDETSSTLDIELYCNIYDTTTNYAAYLSLEFTSYSGMYNILMDSTTGSSTESTNYVKTFATNIQGLHKIPYGDNVKFTFKIYKISSTTSWVPNDSDLLSESSVFVIIKKDLTNFMYSQVVESYDDYDNTVYTVYDIPVIRKDYYNNLSDKSNFTNQVLQKIVDFDVYQYKMLTDFVNLKFANTTGYIHNMKHNKTTQNPVISINPDNIPDDPSIGDRYAIVGEINPWILSDLYKTTLSSKKAYICEYNDSSSWSFTTLKYNDFFTVETYDDSGTQNVIYNGNDIIIPTQTIPLEINILVVPIQGITISNQVLIKNIKNALIDEFGPDFGYNKSIYISKIVETAQQVYGVRYCYVTNPLHDIFFDDDIYSRISQEELLRYTPELIYFSAENINIDIKS